MMTDDRCFLETRILRELAGRHVSNWCPSPKWSVAVIAAGQSVSHRRQDRGNVTCLPPAVTRAHVAVARVGCLTTTVNFGRLVEWKIRLSINNRLIRIWLSITENVFESSILKIYKVTTDTASRVAGQLVREISHITASGYRPIH